MLGNQIPHVYRVSFSNNTTPATFMQHILEVRLDGFCLLFNHHWSRSAFPLKPNFCHFKPFEKTWKCSLLSHSHVEPQKERTLRPLHCFGYQKASEVFFACWANNFRHLILNIILFTCSIHEFAQRAF